MTPTEIEKAMTTETKTEAKPWNLAQFPDDGRQSLRVGDMLRVEAINSDVLDLHWGKCVTYELVPVNSAASQGRIEVLETAARKVIESWDAGKRETERVRIKYHEHFGERELRAALINDAGGGGK